MIRQRTRSCRVQGDLGRAATRRGLGRAVTAAARCARRRSWSLSIGPSSWRRSRRWCALRRVPRSARGLRPVVARSRQERTRALRSAADPRRAGDAEAARPAPGRWDGSRSAGGPSACVPRASGSARCAPTRRRCRTPCSIPATFFALELGEEAVEDGGTQLAQLEAADVRQDVPVPQRLVGPQGYWLKVRNGVGHQPLLSKVGQRYPAGVHESELPQPPQPTDLGIERLGVALPTERLGAIPTVLVAPSDAPYLRAVAPRDLLDAHAWPRSTVRSTERKLLA